MGHVQGDNNYRMPTSPSASILLFLLIRFTTDPVLSEGSFRFTHPIQNIATGREHIVVATEDNLHLFNHMLQIQAVRHPGLLDGRKRNCRGNEAESQVYYNKILLVYNDIILSCWNKNSGTCREYSVNNLTLLKGYGEDIVSCNPEHTAAGLIFQKDKIFFVTAAPTLKGAFGRRTIVIREKNAEDTFTFLEGVELKIQSPVPNIVDAFEWKEKFIFPYYPSNEMRARLLVLDWSDGSLSLNSQYNLTCGTDTQRGVILSSFAFASSGSFFWAGIFSTNNSTSLDKTALCIYNITLLENRSKGCIYTDFDVFNEFPCENYDNPLPIHFKPTISHGDLTAVYVMEVQKTLVLFLGTGNGQLLKVILDSNYTASCPQVLHKFEAEAAVFKTMHLDPVDNTYLYVATVNEIKRVRIAKCEHHQSCSECLSAADPHCGWCQLKKRCTMKAECASDTLLENWIEKFPADMSQTDCKPIKHMPAIGPSCTSPQSVYTLLIPYLDWCLLLLLLHCCIDILLF